MAKKETTVKSEATTETVKLNEAKKETTVKSEATTETVKLNEATVTRNKAYKDLLDWLTKQNNVPAEVLESAKVIRPSYFGIASTGSVGDGLTPAYRKLLALGNGKLPVNGTTWTEMELFTLYRFGATEAKNWCNELAKLAVTGYESAWVKFNITERSYTLVAVQNSVPEGWKGYVPAQYTDTGKAVQAK
jgi:hypothetical protein